jgi:hypothetical protein
MSEQDKEINLKEFFERARKGVLKYLNDKGGLLPLGDVHEYSLKTYLIQHQRFSMMMETFVNEDLVIYDTSSDDVILTDKGKIFIQG